MMLTALCLELLAHVTSARKGQIPVPGCPGVNPIWVTAGAFDSMNSIARVLKTHARKSEARNTRNVAPASVGSGGNAYGEACLLFQSHLGNQLSSTSVGLSPIAVPLSFGRRVDRRTPAIVPEVNEVCNVCWILRSCKNGEERCQAYKTKHTEEHVALIQDESSSRNCK